MLLILRDETRLGRTVNVSSWARGALEQARVTIHYPAHGQELEPVTKDGIKRLVRHSRCDKRKKVREKGSVVIGGWLPYGYGPKKAIGVALLEPMVDKSESEKPYFANG